MRILDREANRVTKKISLLLTPEEAAELRDSLEMLLAHPEGNHAHINDDGYTREITVAIYTRQNRGEFAPDVLLLLEGDEQ